MTDDLLYLKATDGQLSATLVLERAMNYALAHNGISPLKELILRNDSDQPVRGLRLEVELTAPVAGRIAAPLLLDLPEIDHHDQRSFAVRAPWAFDAATIAQLD